MEPTWEEKEQYIEQLRVLFKENAICGQFKDIKNKKSNRRDLHAFILLDSLVPGTSNMVSSAEHDQIWIDVEVWQLGKVATKEVIQELIRCGVHFSGDGLYKFV